ncbi:MAG: hypothetical protein PHC46_04965 [Clostridia bacterium]|nr:hypothetical protein [Clostridia bacterium]
MEYLTKKSYKQKCWSCTKATNMCLCSWVEQYKLPDNAIKDQNGYIIKCPLYEYDNITQIKSLKQQAIEKGEPLNAYYYKKEKTKNVNVSNNKVKTRKRTNAN